MPDREAEALKRGLLPFNDRETYLMNDDHSYKAFMLVSDYDEDVIMWHLNFYSTKNIQRAKLFLKVYYLFGQNRRVEIALRDWPHGLTFKNDAEREKFSTRASREVLKDIGFNGIENKTELATVLASEINSALLTTLYKD